ncbi:unnamed protein product [Heligmosomoides polygyrus]|uniref:PIPK domain-containing protein n=1 Tax=Heligmosomoides polygyrus TaxID=6339 RepID=A0A183GRT9_HELPZ|nr:unnamed protein product [Heligmosomoides polygyrus]
MYLIHQLKSAITIRLLQDRVRSAVSALSALKKKIYQKSSDETFEPSTEFGALDVPPGEFTIPPSSYGPACVFDGGDLSTLYTRLQCKSRVPSSTSEYVNFFNTFIHHVVSEMYSRDVWPRLTARTRRRKNQYVDFESELVINFVKVITNFRRNMKSQEAREQSTSSAAAESDTIPSRPTSQSTNGGLKMSQRTVSSAESDASMALSVSDYSQE